MYKQAIIKQLLKRAGIKDKAKDILHYLDYPGDALGDHIRGIQGDAAQALAVSKILKSLPKDKKFSNAESILAGLGSVGASHIAGALTASPLFGDGGTVTLEDIGDRARGLGKLTSFIPGEATRNDILKQIALEEHFKPMENASKWRSELYGQLTAPIASGAVGSGISGLLAKLLQKKLPDKNISARRAALAGGAAGTGLGILGNIGGLVGAQLTKGRTNEDQGKYYDSTLSTLGNYLIPGMASYNRAKSIGVADRLASALSRAKEKAKNKGKDTPMSIYM